MSRQDEGSGRKKTQSELAAMMAAELVEGESSGRTRQTSNSDVVTKFGYAPQLAYDDLK
jgi:hypothetical protein